MNIKTIKIACDVKDSLTIDEIVPFQKDLKSLSTENYAKLKTQIIHTGFAFPILVWKDEKAGDVKCLGGHQRLRTLQAMRAEGFVIPPVPVVYVEAKDYTEAKRRVLQDASSYGKVETQGLYEFATDAGISLQELEEFQLPEIDLERFGEEFFKDIDPEKNEEKERPKPKEKCEFCGK